MMCLNESFCVALPLRLSVKRISQQAKEELAKQSAQEEAFIRRASIADAVRHCVSYRLYCTVVCV